MAIEANFYPTSLNEVVYEKDGSTINMEDRIIDDQSEKIKNIIFLKEELNKLTSDEKQLIYLRYYFVSATYDKFLVSFFQKVLAMNTLP